MQPVSMNVCGISKTKEQTKSIFIITFAQIFQDKCAVCSFIRLYDMYT